MTVALYSENQEELHQITGYLKCCGREYLRCVDVFGFGNHLEFGRAIRDGMESFDLLVITKDGTSSLEIMDMVRSRYPNMDIFWFSDLDFAVRSYYYGVLWFGQKPVRLEDIQKAFRQKLAHEQSESFRQRGERKHEITEKRR